MKLFEPIKIGRLKIKNRIVMPAMFSGFGSEDGQVTERMIKYYEERAKGGAGLIIVEDTTIERRGRGFPLQPLIDNDRFIPGLSKLARAIQKYGARAAIQLHHAGVKASAKASQIQPVGPSEYSAYPVGMGPPPRALTVEEIHDLVLAFGDAARRAKDAGFDAVEIHGTHSYIVDQFMSPRFNHRTDVYGGNIENRARFACEIIECVKQKAGKIFPVIFRMTADDYVVGGTTLEDARVYARILSKSGADCLHVSVGISDKMVSTPPMSFPRGCFVPLAQGVKEVVNVPVIAVGRIDDPIFGEQILAEEKADLIAMGRSLIADPFLPLKAEKGEFEDIVPCIYCNQGCISRVTNGLPMTCLVNPIVGKELELQMKPATSLKKVLIVGGGPAGLRAAIDARERGHDVVLAEKERRLGGQLNYAWKPPGKEIIGKLINYLCKQAEKLKISIHLGKEVNKEFIQEIEPDIIILATGAKLIVPEIPGAAGKNVFLATEILGGKEPLGKKTIVIGGGQTGLETGDFLAESGQEVTVLEMLSDVARDMSPRDKMFLMKKLSEKNIGVFENRKVKEITNEGVIVDHFGKQEEFIGETVVLAMGLKSERNLLEKLKEIAPSLEDVYVIGDCIEPRTALEAICEGALIARVI